MLDTLTYMAEHGHEQLVTCFDQESGLRALIAIHSTALGPSLGGIRLWRYQLNDDAVLDVLRLSEGMTYKAAVAGLHLGGGKAVILADGQESDPRVREKRLEAFGHFVEGLGGRYIAAEDVGTSVNDILIIRRSTKHVVGGPREQGGSGDPSPFTAYGIAEGMRATIEQVLHTDRFKDLRVAIQGLGKVGADLALRLKTAGARLIATDIRREVCRAMERKLGIEIVEPEAIYEMECEIFAPCALGGVINEETLPRLKCRIVAGSANNQLKSPDHGEALRELGITYAVDYVINAGGLINVADELRGYDERRAREQVGHIYQTIQDLLHLAQRDGISESRAARRIALEQLHRHGPLEPSASQAHLQSWPRT